MKFAIVCEAQADRQIAAELADRVIQNAIDWVDDTNIDSVRKWVDRVSTDSITFALEWKRISSLADKLGIRMHGHFDGEPGKPDAAVARRAIQVLRTLVSPDAIILVRDADNQIIRREGLEQARNVFANNQVVVMGLAVPEREAWVLAGFVPVSPIESSRIDLERKRLGFDPTRNSIRLTALTVDSAERSPKRVLNSLTNGDRQREADCWQHTPLKTLKENGAGNGLADYLREVEEFVVPLIEGRT